MISCFYCGPVLFAGKGGGALRMVMDHRALNGVASRGEYHLPRMGHVIDCLRKPCWFSMLSSQSGYHQVGISESAENGLP